MAYLFKRHFDTSMKNIADDESYRKIRERQESLAKTLTTIINVPVVENDEKEIKKEEKVVAETDANALIEKVFNNIVENNDTYTVDEPITQEEINMNNQVVQEVNEMPETSSEIDSNMGLNIEEITSLTDRLKTALEEENDEKEKAEETRIRFETTVEELRKASEEYTNAIVEIKSNIEKNIEESNKRRDQYRETANEMDKKIDDVVGQTESFREKISYIKSLGEFGYASKQDSNYQNVKKIA